MGCCLVEESVEEIKRRKYKSRDYDIIILSLPEHLALKVHHLVFATTQQNPDNFIRYFNISVKEATEGDVDLSLFISLPHVPYDEAHLIHFPVDVLLSPVGTLGRFGTFFGSSVPCVALVESNGHGVIVVELFTEGVELLALYVIFSKALPAAPQVTHCGHFDLKEDEITQTLRIGQNSGSFRDILRIQSIKDFTKKVQTLDRHIPRLPAMHYCEISPVISSKATRFTRAPFELVQMGLVKGKLWSTSAITKALHLEE
ncbi:hypothetical protein DNTS_015740 [Danionella cerebrum]|uniref:Uncharacterized protein n=1 Tax=Danionella cerebrum TaxID=2873325 RepID=A0A553MQ06_9TELE|nr:hypothetical protein DNTS_015740 [Danionella translucida]